MTTRRDLARCSHDDRMNSHAGHVLVDGHVCTAMIF